MAGKIKKVINQIIEQRAGNNPILISTTRTKLQLKGIDIDKYSDSSPDDNGILEKLIEISKQLNTVIKL